MQEAKSCLSRRRRGAEEMQLQLQKRYSRQDAKNYDMDALSRGTLNFEHVTLNAPIGANQQPR